MVLKTTQCRFSGLRIYPGTGILFVRNDGQQYLFLNRKVKLLQAQRKRPVKLAWTFAYRKAHKKDQSAIDQKRRKKRSARVQNRSIAGASLQVLKEKRGEEKDVRQLNRENVLREIKARQKKQQEAKTQQKTTLGKQTSKQAQKQQQPKGSKLGAARR